MMTVSSQKLFPAFFYVKSLKSQKVPNLNIVAEELRRLCAKKILAVDAGPRLLTTEPERGRSGDIAAGLLYGVSRFSRCLSFRIVTAVVDTDSPNLRAAGAILRRFRAR
jgi:hypothetical protein